MKSALLIVPDYDGSFLPSVPGGRDIVTSATDILSKYGKYNVRVLQDYVARADINREMATLYASGGSVLFFFFGHGILSGTNRCVLATSDSQLFDEGISAEDLIGDVFSSPAREAVVILDCCHAGAARPCATKDVSIRDDTGIGRALFAACSDSQQAWRIPNFRRSLEGCSQTYCSMEWPAPLRAWVRSGPAR